MKPTFNQYTSKGFVAVIRASNRANWPAFTTVFWTVLRKLGGTAPLRPTCGFSSTTRLALHLALPPRFSAITLNTPESSTNTYEKIVAINHRCWKIKKIKFLEPTSPRFLTCLIINMDFVLNVWIWKSGEFWIRKSSLYHLMVGKGSPSNSTSNLACSCSKTRHGWIFLVNDGGTAGFYGMKF